MMTKKQVIVLFVLIAILAGAIFLYRATLERWPWQKESASPIITGSPLPYDKSDPRQIVMNDLSAKIGQISPEGPVLGGQWYINRFWFLEGSYSTFYVEYEDGHIMRRLLLGVDLSQAPKISYNIQAFFEPGETDWILKSGKDQSSGLPLILFEFDDTQGGWIRKN